MKSPSSQQIFMDAGQIQAQLRQQNSAKSNSFAFNRLTGGNTSAKHNTFERKGNENYKSSSRVAHHAQLRHHSGLSSNLSPSSQTNLVGNRTQTNVSAQRNAGVFGLKSDTTLNFDMPMTATTASSDTNMLFKN